MVCVKVSRYVLACQPLNSAGTRLLVDRFACGSVAIGYTLCNDGYMPIAGVCCGDIAYVPTYHICRETEEKDSMNGWSYFPFTHDEHFGGGGRQRKL